MWTAQTYLGAHVATAKYFIYLLSEDYIQEQRDFQDSVIQSLRQLGMRTGHESAIFAPDDCARDCIKKELLDLFRDNLMQKILGKTPGLLFTDKNLKDLNPADDRWVYLSLQPYVDGRSREQLNDLFMRMEGIIKTSSDLLKEIDGPKWRSIWDFIIDKVMLEPNFSGIGFDFKAARSKFLVSKNIK
jgi:hypothetical protein